MSTVPLTRLMLSPGSVASSLMSRGQLSVGTHALLHQTTTEHRDSQHIRERTGFGAQRPYALAREDVPGPLEGCADPSRDERVSRAGLSRSAVPPARLPSGSPVARHRRFEAREGRSG